MALLIDSHAHLSMSQFDNDRDDVICRAKENGLSAILSLATKTDEFDQELSLSAKYPDFIWTALGFHPHEAKSVQDNDYILLENLTKKNSKGVIAIGEIGMDLYYNFSEVSIQEEVFLKQLLLSKKLELPAIIHCRQAYSETLRILKKARVDFKKILFHCFSGSIEQAEEIIALGASLAFGGTITFKKNDLGRAIVSKTPLDQLFIETDCPYLAPIPHRGKRNEPSYVSIVYEKIASIKEISSAELSKKVYDNFKSFFKQSLTPQV